MSLAKHSALPGPPDPERLAWLAARRQGLGSSDAAAICGLSRYQTPLHVYLSKTGDYETEDNGRLRWGRLLEDVIAQAYAEITGHVVEAPAQKILTHARYPWMLASLDRIARPPGEDERILEIKAVNNPGPDWGEAGTDEVPREYLIQVQHQLCVTGLERADLAALMRQEDVKVYHIRRDEDLLAKLVRIEEDFWRHVERRDAPAPDWQHPLALEAVQAYLTDVDEGVALELDNEASALAERYEAAGRAAREANAERDTLRAQLLWRMGQAERASAPGFRLTRRLVERAEYTVDAGSYVRLDVRRQRLPASS